MKCQHRGPDNTKDVLFNFDEWKLYYMFHRLAINGLSAAGDQPININNKRNKTKIMKIMTLASILNHC